ncbi:SDR family NAD(P)-dependent oxidoreductase [Nonomuraea sp. NPDC002799]
MGALTGKVAFVTGGARGIGRCVADVLAADGATVVVADRRIEGVTAADGIARVHQADVAVREEISEAVRATAAEFGGIDILVNNAGMDAARPDTWNQQPDEWTRVIDVNLNGAWWCTSAALPHMIPRGGGRVVFIGSNAARLGGFGVGHSPAYSAAKAALSGLVVALSSQLEQFGIRVNAISSGPTGSTGTPPTDEERAEFLGKSPLGYGGPEPIAAAVRYLVHPSGDWVSGSVMNVSGGEHRGI